MAKQQPARGGLRETRRTSRRAPVRDGDPFVQFDPQTKPKAPELIFAVRKVRGPGTHEGYQVFKAHDESDARRQWYNWAGVASRSHAYDLQVVQLSANHPAAEKAIKADRPSADGDGQGLSLKEMIDADFSEVQQQIAQGGAKPPTVAAGKPD